MSAPKPTTMERLKILVISLALAVAISTLLKIFVNIPRPCQLDPSLYSACLPDFAFPSGHVGQAFSFVFPLLGQHVLFPLSFIIGILVSWSRVSQGLHTWPDIGGGIAIAGLSYAIAEAFVLRKKEIINRGDERSRKALHIISNVSVCLLIWILGIPTASNLILAGTCIGIFIIHITLTGINIPGIEKWLKNVGRDGEIPGEGAMYNALGVLFVLGLLRNEPVEAITAILILALGDGLATYFGTTYGRHHLPWNRKKTIEGSIGFVAGAMLTLLILPLPVTVLVIVLAMVIESLPLKLNDNITLPAVTSLIFYFI